MFPSFPPCDLDRLINEIAKSKNDRFVYLSYSVATSSVLFTPYNLMVVEFEDTDRKQYLTMSRHGVTYWSQSENSFTRLNDWHSEYRRYCCLMKVCGNIVLARELNLKVLFKYQPLSYFKCVLLENIQFN